MDECNDNTCISGKVMQSQSSNTYYFYCNPVTLHKGHKIEKKCESPICDQADEGKHGGNVSGMAWHTHVVCCWAILKWWMVWHYPIFLPCQCVWRNESFYSSILKQYYSFIAAYDCYVLRSTNGEYRLLKWKRRAWEVYGAYGVVMWSTIEVSWFIVMNSAICFIFY